jgi:hypothetical protein
MRAPQYRRVTERKRILPVGPNPAAGKGLRVRPFANIFALVEGLGVVSLHRTEADAKTALEQEQERRKSLELREVEAVAARAAPDEAHEAKADGEHRPS